MTDFWPCCEMILTAMLRTNMKSESLGSKMFQDATVFLFSNPLLKRVLSVVVTEHFVPLPCNFMFLSKTQYVEWSKMPVFYNWSCQIMWTSEDLKPSVFKTNLVVLTRKSLPVYFIVKTRNTQLPLVIVLTPAVLKWLWNYSLPSFTRYRRPWT